MGTLRYFFYLCSFPIIFPSAISLKGKPAEIWQENLLSYWNQYYQSHKVISSKAAKIFLDKKKWNGAQMKSQTYDTWNKQVVWDKSGRQIVLFEAIHAKWKFHDYKKIKIWNDFDVKLSDCKRGLRNFEVTLNIQVSNSLQWMAKIWDKWKT